MPGTTVAAVNQHFSSRASAKDWTRALRPDSEPSSDTRILRYLPMGFVLGCVNAYPPRSPFVKGGRRGFAA